ncbi:MAG: cysteine-rich CWC family protein [Azovibrio sp.]
MDHQNSESAKNCARCGQEMTCGAQQKQCWCMNQTPLKTLPPYQDCLCPDCLELWRSKGADGFKELDALG